MMPSVLKRALIFDFKRAWSRLICSQVSDRLFESAPPLIRFAVDRMNAIQAQQLGELAGINRIGFVGIFGNRR